MDKYECTHIGEGSLPFWYEKNIFIHVGSTFHIESTCNSANFNKIWFVRSNADRKP